MFTHLLKNENIYQVTSAHENNIIYKVLHITSLLGQFWSCLSSYNTQTDTNMHTINDLTNLVAI